MKRVCHRLFVPCWYRNRSNGQDTVRDVRQMRCSIILEISRVQTSGKNVSIKVQRKSRIPKTRSNEPATVKTVDMFVKLA